MQYWLTATHLKSGERARIDLGALPVTVGRGQAEHPDAQQRLSLAFDPMLSRNHFEARLDGQRLKVRRLENRHPLFWQGQEQVEFCLEPGQHFTSAQTSFEFTGRPTSLGEPTRAGTVLVDLSRLRELDAERCLKAVLGLQPLLAQGLAAEPFFSQALSVLSQIVPMASAIFVMRVQGERYDTIASLDQHNEHGPSRTLLRQAVTGGEPVCYFWDQVGAQAATVIGNSRWAVAAPIPVSQEECFVLYSVGSEQALSVTNSGRTPGDLDRAVLAFVANLLSGHFQARRTAQQVEEERRQRELTQNLHQILQALTATLEPSEIQACLSEHLVRLVGCDKVEFGLAGPTQPSQSGGGQSWTLEVPLRRRDLIQGSVSLFRHGQPFREDEINLALSLCAQATTALENAQMFKTVQRQAIIDELTGLYNRRHFFELAEALRAESQEVSVIIFDVDHFKKFNDNHGHLVGDEVLRLVAGAAARTFPPPHALGRYGGEEFAVASALDLAQLADLAEHLRQAIEATALCTPEGRLSVTVSVGLAGGRGPLEALLGRADDALYQAKSAGRNRVVMSAVARD